MAAPARAAARPAELHRRQPDSRPDRRLELQAHLGDPSEDDSGAVHEFSSVGLSCSISWRRSASCRPKNLLRASRSGCRCRVRGSERRSRVLKGSGTHGGPTSGTPSGKVLRRTPRSRSRRGATRSDARTAGTRSSERWAAMGETPVRARAAVRVEGRSTARRLQDEDGGVRLLELGLRQGRQRGGDAD